MSEGIVWDINNYHKFNSKNIKFNVGGKTVNSFKQDGTKIASHRIFLDIPIAMLVPTHFITQGGFERDEYSLGSYDFEFPLDDNVNNIKKFKDFLCILDNVIEEEIKKTIKKLVKEEKIDKIYEESIMIPSFSKSSNENYCDTMKVQYKINHKMEKNKEIFESKEINSKDKHKEYFIENSTCTIKVGNKNSKNLNIISNNVKIKDIPSLINVYKAENHLLIEINHVILNVHKKIPRIKTDRKIIQQILYPSNVNSNKRQYKPIEDIDNSEDEYGNEEKVDSKELENNKIDTEDTDDEINQKLEDTQIDLSNSDSESEKVVEEKSKKGRKKKEQINIK